MAIESTAGGLDGALVWELAKADLVGCGAERHIAFGMVHPDRSARTPLCGPIRNRRLYEFVCCLPKGLLP